MCGGPSARRLGDMKCGEPVFKCGAKTGATAGYYYGLRTSGEALRADHTVRPFPSIADGDRESFVDCGDSGSVVFNFAGAVIGLVWGGGPSGRLHAGEGYVTPIGDVF